MTTGLYTRIGSETKTFTVTALLKLVDVIHRRVLHPAHLDQTLSGEVEYSTDWNPSRAGAAEAMIWNMHDLRRRAKTLATGTLLRPETQKQRLRMLPTGHPGTSSPALDAPVQHLTQGEVLDIETLTDEAEIKGAVRYGRLCTFGPTELDQVLPAVASQFVDHVMAPRSPG